MKKVSCNGFPNVAAYKHTYTHVLCLQTSEKGDLFKYLMYHG